MDAEQYEELCRRFIAEKEGLSLSDVRSVRIPNPQRPGLPGYGHQIDLYWETGSDIATYLNIANVKWRGKEKIKQEELLLLQQVRQKVAAHKAFVITNGSFTRGAIAVAMNEGIALHVVQPLVDASELPRGDRAAIQVRLAAIAAKEPRPLWSHQVRHKGLAFNRDTGKPEVAPRESLKPASSTSYASRVPQTLPQQPSAPLDSQSARDVEIRPGPGWGASGDGRDRVVEK